MSSEDTGGGSSGCGSVIMDPLYIKGIPGILKYLENGFSILAFILQAASIICVPISTNGYFLFVTMTVFWVNLIYYLLLLFKLKERVFRCDCIQWPIIEFGYLMIVIIFYFFADLFLAIAASCSSLSQAATAFGFFALFTFIADAILSFRVVLDSRHLHTSEDQPPPVSNIEAPTQRY